MSDQDLICVGAIAGAYGVRGEVRVKSYCAVPEDIEDYRPLSTEDGSRTFTLALLHPVKNGFAARIAEINAARDLLLNQLTTDPSEPRE
jgi:16S rRNA processing protein RimM